MQHVNKVIKNTGFLYAKMGITMFISLYTTRLILNALGASDFGIFNIVGGAIAMLGFLNAAMAGATQRFMSYSEGEGDKEKQTRIFNISIVIHFAISIIVGIVLLAAGYFFFNGILNIAPDRIYAAKVVYGSLIVSTIFTVMTVPYDAVMNAHENMLYYSIVGVVESFMKLAVALAVVYTVGDKLILYGILMAIIPLITMTIMRIYCHKHYSECVIAPKRYWDKGMMKEMAGFAGWNFTSTTTSMVGNYGVGVLLNHFFGTVLNASFGIAAQLNGQLVAFSSNMLKALNPSIVKAEGGGERQNMIKIAFIGCKFSFFLFSFFTIPFLIETSTILKIWLKNTPDWSIIFCRLAILRTLIEQLTLPLNTAINAQGEIKKYTVFRSLLYLIPLPLIFILFLNGFPAYSMLIVTLLIGGVADGINSLYFAIVKCKVILSEYIRIVFMKVFWVFLVSVFFGFLPLFFLGDSIQRLLLVMSMSMISFLFMFYFYGLAKEERRQLSLIISSIKFNKLTR